ncbi:hypothetical protein [Nocardiopsis gilva]|uniref:hypothetical protein n=1 Tax=Nocardiopsis gilva TaxID=280236 RepID=UPI001E4FBD77|nr:hypothetical protein [Nocardiopsis gilva]
MTTNLDALLTALYVHLDDHVLPSGEQPRTPGPSRLLTDAELVCVAIAQVLLGCDSERRWMRTAPTRIDHLFPRLPGQSEYNRHLRALAPQLLATCLWPAHAVPTWRERLRLMDGTPSGAAPPASRSTAGGWARSPPTGATPPTTPSTRAHNC